MTLTHDLPQAIVEVVVPTQPLLAGTPTDPRTNSAAETPAGGIVDLSVGAQTSQQAVLLSNPIELVPAANQTIVSDQKSCVTRDGDVVGGQTSPPAIDGLTPVVPMPVVDPLLFVHATAHGDLEQQRIASEHRLRILTTTTPDEDGVMRGFGLDESHPDVARLAGITQALKALEHDAELGLKRALRRCAIAPWVKMQVGLGEKQVARLLAVIGDPYWHLAEDRPRTVSELWAYSGLHVLPVSQFPNDARRTPADGIKFAAGQDVRDTQDIDAGGNQTSDADLDRHDTPSLVVGVAARRRKGQKANWSTEAKTRAYLCATSCIKQERSPYRVVYLARREHTAETHPDWTAGHSHNDGLRIASKEILKDLWREAKRLHEAASC